MIVLMKYTVCDTSFLHHHGPTEGGGSVAEDEKTGTGCSVTVQKLKDTAANDENGS